jgi:hypothetical protein
MKSNKEILVTNIMGASTSTLEKEVFENEVILYHLNNFIESYCTVKSEIYMNYYEFCYAFGIYLKNECDNILPFIKYIVRREPVNSDFIIFTKNFVNYLCEKKKLIRIGNWNENPILYGINLNKFPKIQI